MPLPQWARFLALGFFYSHIPATVCFDAQILFRKYFPAALTSAYAWWVNTFKDPLLAPATPAPWFASFIWLEVFFQLPCFIAMLYGLHNEKEWVRPLGLVYCPHVMTTMAPILASIWLAQNTFHNKIVLLSVYAPYLLIPGVLLWQLWVHDPLFERKQKRN